MFQSPALKTTLWGDLRKAATGILAEDLVGNQLKVRYSL